MAYRMAFCLLPLLWPGPVWAAAPKIALWVEGGGARHDELVASLERTLDAEPATAPTLPADDAGLRAVRSDLHVARLVVVRIELQGRAHYTLAAHAVDESGVAHRFAEADEANLGSVTLKLVAELPPLPAPEEAGAPAAGRKEDAPPPTGQLTEPPAPAAPAPAPVYRKRHPYAMLVAGAVTFFVPYLTTVGFAANYQSYNANAARVGYIPIAGPFLARQRISDKDLKDGYDPGLLVDGIVQVLTANLLIAGIVYCAVGEKRIEYERHARVQPLLGVGAGGARVGAMVTW